MKTTIIAAIMGASLRSRSTRAEWQMCPVISRAPVSTPRGSRGQRRGSILEKPFTEQVRLAGKTAGIEAAPEIMVRTRQSAGCNGLRTMPNENIF
jgi:hypothetical protein